MGDQKRVLVTAGASGIGRAVVQAFVDAGAKVHVADIDVKALEALGQQLPQVSSSR
jgi:NAD(P)-dependent dehydrogenase (short-subunit alcohol dehydrogenase family)